MEEREPFEFVRQRRTRVKLTAGDIFRIRSTWGNHFGLVVNPNSKYLDSEDGLALCYIYKGVFKDDVKLNDIPMGLDDMYRRPERFTTAMWNVGWFQLVRDDVRDEPPPVLDTHPLNVGYRVFDEHGAALGKTHEHDGTPIPDAIKPLGSVSFIVSLQGVENFVKNAATA